MICAVTIRSKIFLLDWKGSHMKGKGPTLVLIEFNRSQARIKNRTRGIVHQIIEIEEDGNCARIECNLGATNSNKIMNREVIRLLKNEVTIPVGISNARPNSIRTFKDPSTNFRWVSTGGGWPAMVGSMAFANVFSQAGLITNNSSRFSAVSTQSGATWFSTQFFYSPQFFDKVVNSNPKQLSDFVFQWTKAYENMYGENSKQQKRNSFLKDFTESTTLKVLADYATVFNEYDGDWASFTFRFMEAASEGYGDPTLVDRTFVQKTGFFKCRIRIFTLKQHLRRIVEIVNQLSFWDQKAMIVKYTPCQQLFSIQSHRMKQCTIPHFPIVI
jgi:hypothetical protein